MESDETAMRLIAPTALLPGDRIGIVAPASHFDRHALQAGMDILVNLGFQVRLGRALFARQGYLAGSDGLRASDLHLMFGDPAIKAIFCARGGYGSMRLLPHLDWDLMRANPKIVLGFSDITVLLNALYQRSGLITYHGPLVTELGHISEAGRNALLCALSTADDITVRPLNPVVLRAGTAEGPLMGGNLTLLCHLLGTPYEPKVDGHLLFLEDRGEELYRVDRMLCQLNLAGWFERIKGLVLGQFTDCGDPAEIYDLAAQLGSRARIPVMAGLDIGHADPNITLPIGGRALLDSARGTLWIRRRGSDQRPSTS